MFSYSLSLTALLAALFMSAALVPSSLRAQRSAAADSVNIAHLSAAAMLGPVALADAPALAPRVAAVGITRRVHVDALGLVPSQDRPRNVGVGPNLALMGTGAAGVVIGLLVGGDGGAAIAVGGGILGLVGFYRYLR
jgi:hypothetical protein